ncbi:MAG: DUF4255 domain-containing protein [Xenococcaceae cyanobacterium MO_167.B27]|nr:DUF4255 domain-containing protein [Xenococcaceae cyanobacterium MO_167.B27]
MSNYLAIATVTATLQRILQDTVQIDVEGARVTTVRPDNVGRGIPETGVNIFLYRVAPVNWRNQDLPGRRSTGELQKRPQIALELNYILTFYGNEVELEPQRLLGSVVRTMYSQPVLQLEAIRNTLEDSSFRYLRESDLSEQVELVKFSPLSLSTEDLSKIWSVFFQTPYNLSFAYQGVAVLIESQDIPRRALPVREQITRISPQKPVISKVTCLDEPLTQVWQSTENRLILANSTIAIEGLRLQGSNNLVRIGGIDAIPQEVSDRKIVLDLNTVSNNNLRAGVQGIQVIKRNSEDHRITESNVFPLVLLPTLQKIAVEAVRPIGEELYTVRVSIATQPTIGKNQRLNLVLNSTTGERDQEYVFKIPPLEADSDRIITEISPIASGEYLARLQVDGVESLLTVDTDKNSPNYQKYIAPLLIVSG